MQIKIKKNSQKGIAFIHIILSVLGGIVILGGIICGILYFSNLSLLAEKCGNGICNTLEKLRCVQDCQTLEFSENDIKNNANNLNTDCDFNKDEKIGSVEQQICGKNSSEANQSQQENISKSVISDLKYSTVDSNAVKLDLYLPSDNCSGKYPVIISIHGGAFRAGDKIPVKTKYLTNECYAVASVNYRLSGEALFPAGNQDVKSAVRWLRANASKYNLDAEHFGAIGGSAGGYFSSFLGVTGDTKDFDVGDNLEYSSAVQAVVDEFGPVDFSILAQDRVDAKLATDSAESNYIGCDIGSAACESAIKASPVSYISKGDSSFFILHGEKDKTIPIKQSQDFYQRLQNAGVSATLITIPNAGHGGLEFNNYESQIIEFFNKYLK